MHDSIACLYLSSLCNALQLPDGANAIIIGQLSEDDPCLALVGGNCAIQGLDFEGQDKYWTVSTYMCMMPAE